MRKDRDTAHGRPPTGTATTRTAGREQVALPSPRMDEGHWSTGMTVVDGLRIRWRRSGGAGPRVVLAHGLSDNGRCWRRLARILAVDHDVVVYDARGHGDSDRADSYAYPDQVADLVGLLESLGPQPVTLVGHSMGGAHATAVAAGRPELVRSLVLEDPHWPPPDREPDAHSIRAWQFGLAANRRRPREQVLADGRRDNPGWHPDDLETWAEAQQQADPAVPGWLRSPEIRRWPEQLARVTVPVLVVTGDGGVTVTPQVAAEAARRCPGPVTVTRLPGAGHCVRRDRFDPFATAVTDFLGRTAPRR